MDVVLSVNRQQDEVFQLKHAEIVTAITHGVVGGKTPSHHIPPH